MTVDSLAYEVLQQYDLREVTDVVSLGNAGGFSGAALWRVLAQENQVCLRLWPNSGYSPNYPWLHEVLRRSLEACVPVASPILNRDGQKLVKLRGRCFELSPWMSGVADFNEDPSEDRLRSLMGYVAMFHETFHDSFRYSQSPAVAARVALLRDAPGVIAKLSRGNLSPAPTPPVDHLARRLLPALVERVPRIAPRLSKFLSVELQLGPVIRDLHHDHVLFTDDRLTGIVDFGSMSIDSRCLDLARLVGSLKVGNVPPWKLALAVYSQSVQGNGHGDELSATEIELIELLHQCNLALGALNWLDWILLQKRQFEDWSAVEKRLQYFAESFQV